LKSNSPLTLASPHLSESTVKLFKKIVALGVLHGDVRLANVMVTQNGQLFLIDFGLAVVDVGVLLLKNLFSRMSYNFIAIRPFYTFPNHVLSAKDYWFDQQLLARPTIFGLIKDRWLDQ
jgi:serine/threonine protein kinase